VAAVGFRSQSGSLAELGFLQHLSNMERRVHCLGSLEDDGPILLDRSTRPQKDGKETILLHDVSNQTKMLPSEFGLCCHFP
jgi:hypothetical protein